MLTLAPFHLGLLACLMFSAVSCRDDPASTSPKPSREKAAKKTTVRKAPAPPPKAPLPPGMVDDAELTAALIQEVHGLLGRDAFTELDRKAAEIRTTKSRWPSGEPQLKSLYEGLTWRASEPWQDYADRLQRWAKAAPRSVTAQAALGISLKNYAWHARGSATADQVTAEGWRLFEERLAQARRALEAAAKLDQQDPHVFTAMITVGMGQSWPRAQVENVFQKALAADEDYFEAYYAYAYYLLPRWNGTPGDWQRFTLEATTNTRSRLGQSLLARIAWNLPRIPNYTQEMRLDEDFFRRNGLSWEQVREGFDDWGRRHPASIQVQHRRAVMAVAARDRSTARAAFAAVGEAFDSTLYDNIWQLAARKLWASEPDDAPARRPWRTLEHPSLYQGVCLGFGTNADFLAVGYGSGQVAGWDVRRGQIRFITPKAERKPFSLAVSANGKLIASAAGPGRDPAAKGEISLWEATTGKLKQRLQRRSQIWGLDFSTDGKWLGSAGGHWDNFAEFILHDIASGTERPVKWEGTVVPEAFAFSPDSRWFVAACQQTFWAWDMAGNRFVCDMHTRGATHESTIRSFAFTPDGKLLATGCAFRRDQRNSPGQIVIWNTSDWTRTSFDTGPIGGVSSLAISPDGALLVSGGYDHAITVWELKTGKRRAVLPAHLGIVRSVAISSDGFLASGAEDGAVKVWKLGDL